MWVNNLKVASYRAPRPSQKGVVHWAIYQVTRNVKLADAYRSLANHSTESTQYLRQNRLAVEATYINQPLPVE